MDSDCQRRIEQRIAAEQHPRMPLATPSMKDAAVSGDMRFALKASLAHTTEASESACYRITTHSHATGIY
jgi:hypothetical protein